MPNRNKISLFEGVDRIAICCYFLLVLVGFVNITSASYNDELEVLSFSQNYIKQIVWTGAAFCVGLFILLLDSRFLSYVCLLCLCGRYFDAYSRTVVR